MKKVYYLLIMVLFFSCSKDNQEEKLVLGVNDSLLFGSLSGECIENCFKIYKLSKSEVFKDVNPQFELGNYIENQASLSVLNNEKFTVANDLLNYFPNDILDEERRIGNPSELDGATLYVRLTKSGVTKIWEIDDRPEKIPAKYRPFLQKLKEKINQLN